MKMKKNLGTVSRQLLSAYSSVQCTAVHCIHKHRSTVQSGMFQLYYGLDIRKYVFFFYSSFLFHCLTAMKHYYTSPHNFTLAQKLKQDHGNKTRVTFSL